MNGKLYIKKFIRDDGETLSFDAEEIYLSKNNTLLVRSDPATTAVEFTEEDGGEMIRQRGATYSQPVSGLIVPKSTEYWALCVRLSRFFILNHTYKIVYIKRDGSMFSMNRAWINAGLQIVPVPYENYSTWTIEFRIGDSFWTEYAEDSQGKEIYSNTVELPLLTAGTGGEVWNDVTQQTLSGLGNYFTIDGTSISASINKLEVGGDTYQQTYSGYNLIDLVPITNTQPTTSQYCTTETVMDATLRRNVLHITGTNSYPTVVYQLPQRLESGKYYALKFTYRSTVSGSPQDPNMWFAPNWATNYWDVLGSLNSGRAKSGDGDTATYVEQSTAWKTTSRRFYVVPSQHSATRYSYTDICFSLGYNANATKEVWLADAEVYEITEDEWNADTYTSKDYEPYVGGIPSPRPDYPQTINVVSGEQTINVRGKNMFNVNKPLENKYLDSSGGWVTATYSYINQEYIVTGSSELSFSFAKKNGSPIIRVGEFKTDGTFIKRTLVSTALTLTLDALTNKIIFSVDNLSPNYFDDLQIELGSSPTSYQPYTSQSYTVDLGSIELCKIGDYQDYIYKSGDDWYIHKACMNRILDSSSEWGVQGYGGYTYISGYNQHYFDDASTDASNITVKSSQFTPVSWDNRTLNIRNSIYINLATPSRPRLEIRNVGWASVADVVTWFTAHPATIYYALATPTDTKITDATLVGQLNALAGAQAYNGKTIYQTDSATMPAILSVELLQSVGGGEVWDNVGAVWEEGVGGVQTINVETTQTTYPVWTVTGPCSNPTLQNDTTDTLASFDGMIASGQTLTVDFADNTAYLDSAPVAKYVSGYVSLAPGENAIGFNSDGGSTQTSTISWDNIIN